MSSTGGESDEEIRRPRGRAARRMMKDAADLSSPVQRSNRKTYAASDEEPELYNVTPSRDRRHLNADNSSPLATPFHNRTPAQTSLFVSPTKSQDANSDSEDQSTDLFRNKSRFAELVAQKRAEREAKEAEVAAKRREQLANLELTRSDLIEDAGDFIESQDVVDPEVDRIMSDAAQPTRKASKRAMLEIERETQRLARQQALAHQMKTKKKFTMTDLLAKFEPGPVVEQLEVPPVDMSASSVLNSDASEPRSHRGRRDTPPSSPPTPFDRQRALVERGALSKLVPIREDTLASLEQFSSDEGDLPEVAEIIRSSQTVVAAEETNAAPTKGFKLARLGKKPAAMIASDTSDDELEIVRDAPTRFSIFDKVKSNTRHRHADSKALHTLRHLSHIGADPVKVTRRGKAAARPSVAPQVLESQLRARAREQARAEQLERIAELKAKGIEVLSAEDREKDAEQLENLLEKARQDALKIRQAEKESDALEKDDDGEFEAVASEDEEEEDEDFDGSSGSEDMEDVSDAEEGGVDLVDDAAEESEEEEMEEAAVPAGLGSETELGETVMAESTAAQIGDADASADEEADEPQTSRFTARTRKSRMTVVDDEDEEDGSASQTLRPSKILSRISTPAQDPFAAFGFGAHNAGNALMSPTQAFNATMQTPTQLTQQDSMDMLRQFAPPIISSVPTVPTYPDFGTQDDEPISVIPASQPGHDGQVDLAWETQAPETPVTQLKRAESAVTIETPGWEPTQDDGLPSLWQPAAELRRGSLPESLAEYQTQSTVRLRISESPAPAAKRARLVRGHRRVQQLSDDEEEADAPAPVATKNAFREMARQRRDAMNAAEREEAARQAKGMMDEAAEESEDEYAGLGGDDYIAPETEQDHDIIDSSHIEVDERALAAHYAERQRIEDEANANKLYRDLTTGALRRKQANMFDLDEDEGDLALRRRQARQREEARRRRVLLQDDNIAGLAEGKHSKGKDAFLKAIADDGGDEDMVDLSDEEDFTAAEDQAAEPAAADAAGPLSEISGNKRRREDTAEERLPANKRRTQASVFRAPTSMLQVKQSLSFLLDEPDVTFMPSQTDNAEEASEDEEVEEADDAELPDEPSDEEDEVEAELARQNDGGFAPDRAMMPPPTSRLPATQRRTPAVPAVVDRLSMKRSASNAETAVNGPSAWAAPSGSIGSFGVPSLLRRATTNTALTANDRGVTTSNGSLSRENSAGSSGSGVKMGGTKRSSLAYQARAEERKAIVEAGVRQRAENTARIAEMRRTMSGSLGRGLTGTFE